MARRWCYQPSLSTRRRKQFLIASAIYVIGSLGVAHTNPSLFLVGVSRWMQVADYETLAYNYDHMSPTEKKRLRKHHASSSSSSSTTKATRDDLPKKWTTTRLAHIDDVAQFTTGKLIVTNNSERHSTHHDGAKRKKTADDILLADKIQQLASMRRTWRIQGERNRKEHMVNSEKWNDNPVFVVSLPGTATLATTRYFRCGLGGTKDFAAYWTPTSINNANNSTINDNNKQIEIGRCVQENLSANKPILQDCGKAKVWSSIGYISPMQGKCYYPTLDHTAMTALSSTYPQATILQVTQDPDEWYQTSYRKFRTQMTTHCRNHHHAPIPSEGASREEWIAFYKWYVQSIRDFASAHPNLHYVEVALDDRNTSAVLQQQLSLPRLCWHVDKPSANRVPAKKRENIADSQRLQQNTRAVKEAKPKLPYPILVASLPKSGTTSTQVRKRLML
jgi:hypothetical protein